MFLRTEIFLLRKNDAKNPINNTVIVPNTIVKLAWKGLLRLVQESLKIKGERLIQEITNTPQITPMAAALLLTFNDIKPSKKSPRIPPLNIEARAHHASNALSTPLSASPIIIPKAPMQNEEM